MFHFPVTLKPIYNNLSIKKDKAFLTYQTQETCFEIKKRENFGFREEVVFNSTSNLNYKGIIHTQKLSIFHGNPMGVLVKNENEI